MTREVLFLRDVRHDLPRILDARERILADAGADASAPLPAFIQQAPATEGALLELAVSVVVPHRRNAWAIRDVRAEPACACAGCTRTGGRLVRLGDQTSLYTTNLYGAGGSVYEQARDMFRAAQDLLAACGMDFRDVVRTWVYLRDIARDYDALNLARREFFLESGVDPRPASTGVQGVPFPDAHDVSLVLQAVKSPRGLHATSMSTPSLNEAWSYGADFSRGLKITEANGVMLHVSGTASIDECGRTIHVGDFPAQVERTLDNIESLLAQEGATFENLVSGVAYVTNPDDAPRLQARFRERGFDGFPWALVQAPLCRPELLCEAEAVAVLPFDTAGA